jgi:hypothetical protein
MNKVERPDAGLARRGDQGMAVRVIGFCQFGGCFFRDLSFGTIG